MILCVILQNNSKIYKSIGNEQYDRWKINKIKKKK